MITMDNSSEKITIQIKLNGKHLKIFNDVKKEHGFKRNTEVLRHIIYDFGEKTKLTKNQQSRY